MIRMTRIYNFLSSTVTLITRQASILFGQRTIIMEAINHEIINKHRFSAIREQSLHLMDKHVYYN